MEQKIDGIRVLVRNSIPRTWVEDFGKELAGANIEPIVEWRGDEMQAGIEWLLPTAAVLAIPTAYLSAMAAEAGKDHYHIVKNAIVQFAKKTFKLQPKTVASPPGKVGPDSPGILTIIIGGEGDIPPIRFVFPSEPEVALVALNAIVTVMEDEETRQEVESSMVRKTATGRAAWKFIAKFDEDSGRWEVIDPLRPS